MPPRGGGAGLLSRFVPIIFLSLIFIGGLIRIIPYLQSASPVDVSSAAGDAPQEVRDLLIEASIQSITGSVAAPQTASLKISGGVDIAPSREPLPHLTAAQPLQSSPSPVKVNVRPAQVVKGPPRNDVASHVHVDVGGRTSYRPHTALQIVYKDPPVSSLPAAPPPKPKKITKRSQEFLPEYQPCCDTRPAGISSYPP